METTNNMENEGRDMSLATAHSARWRNNPYYPFHKGIKTRNKVIKEEVSKMDFKKFEPSSLQDHLNDLVWNEDQTIKSDIRDYLLKVANEFIDFLDLKDTVKVKDIILTGSMANYNWNEQSDLDVHVILNFKDIDKNLEFVRNFMDMKKVLWEKKHDVELKGHNVECYVEDENEAIKAAGVYSLMNNKWIDTPSKDSKVQINKELVAQKAEVIASKIDDLEKIKDEDQRIEAVDNLKAKIKKMRKEGLDTKQEELSTENLVFKVLRNTGYLEKLSDIKDEAIDKLLAFSPAKEEDALDENTDESSKDNKRKKFFGIVRTLQNDTMKPSKLYKGEEDLQENDDDDQESEDVGYGCLMLDINMPKWNNVLAKIDSNDIYIGDGDFGLEKDPHITILYGFESSVDSDNIKNFIDQRVKAPIKVALKGISLFENEKFDVLKIDIDSQELVDLNQQLRNTFPYKSTYPDYHPHLTIAYLKPGMGKKYVSNLGGITKESSEFTYSLGVAGKREKMTWNPLSDKTERIISFPANNGYNTLGVVSDEQVNPQKLDYIKDFIQFACDNIGMKNPVKVFLRNGRDEYIMTTASYVPSENSNHINIKNRSTVDILRSIAHELTHNRQREIGSIAVGVPVPNIGGVIENEADSVAGMLIKMYTHMNGCSDVYDMN